MRCENVLVVTQWELFEIMRIGKFTINGDELAGRLQRISLVNIVMILFMVALN